MFLGLLKTLRPKQWIKNAFVGVPLVFGQKLLDLDALWRVAAAFALFCLVSGCVYVINDIVDVEKDRAHPKKKSRPIASGKLPPSIARNFTIVAVPFALGAAFMLAPLYAATLGGYFGLNIAYCFWTKKVPYLDVLSIATGFVLRVLAGALVIGLPPSPWLLGCTALLAMFLGFGKRAHEFAQSGAKTRSVLEHYSGDALRWVLHTLALLTAVVYGLYTQSAHVAATFGDAPLIYTLPFPIIGILRFIHLVTSRPDAESPTEEMLRDWLFMGNFVVWLVVTGLVLYWGQ
ncbi:Decaprenyl-phosphate phosphoribosyltransferase [Enhygromyxa salina]|uniref:Decaprenyl-phosphate phosphoribosyltransferase n=1 Tax=Enhygromyxa salina TaxID=215803 RepID=A0A2S9XLT6_9BACT|nr:decaprenyl-phosphate phosphoribosyltransferase [Enhygromyxa salina]PRP93836.1 Decaprenyl-phosphate phosphoribosyltransferase [Enhygromyxa salina]